jgi:N-acetylmuramic acid 6-phosphate etherase
MTAQQDPSENPIRQLTTESRNAASTGIDEFSALEIVQLMVDEDRTIADAVELESPSIAAAIDVIARQLKIGGRLIYMGAGTSGRLGVLDASECPPTFSTPPEWVVGLIAGGSDALTRAIEGAEDYPQQGAQDLREIVLTNHDVVVGIATSGRTPYVIGGLEFARSLGAFTIGFSCNQDSPLENIADLMIVPVVGPEVVSGSTRLKAGTATKMVLNMLTTGAMVRLGKTYGNLMVDLSATNEKLAIRSCNIVMEFSGLQRQAAQAVLERCDGELKTAIVAAKCNVSSDVARQRLSRADNHLRAALETDA